ncbi:hypothetical protein EC970010_2305B, partial [Escherichia coli 97.0010]
TSSAL